MNESETGLKKWWIYQKERFPLAAHAPLILSFSFCAAAFSARLRANSWPELGTVIVAFISCLLFFLQLRIADEFKDAEEDARWRPYRPVPRGLVSLKELGGLFVIASVIQLALALWWTKYLIVLLIVAWTYLAAMSFEFGMRAWLKSHPMIYLLSHMLIMPIVDFYATASDWLPNSTMPPKGLGFFLIASFCNGIVIELGRKIRAKEQEEEGVETYSVLWGASRASWVWAGMVVATAVFACLAAIEVASVTWVATILGVFVFFILMQVMMFSKQQTEKGSKRIELFSGLWTIILYLSLGIVPGLVN